ncbi:hypothetical protein NFI96_002701 [Prochilodus magdalenae]|nr:hypothetical protein NFI96_002701 [Prochilodus magdalenae]
MLLLRVLTEEPAADTLYFFSVGLILLGDADGFSVWNKSPVPEWHTGRSILSRDQPQPPLQNVVFDTPRIQPFDVASTNANAEWTTLESNSQLPTSRSQIAQHGSIPSQTSFGADKPAQNVHQGSYRTAPSRPYWYASSSWKPSNCGPSARNQDEARPTAHFQGSENELAPTYEQNSYGAQISEASRWYSLQGQHPQASMYQNTQSQSNKPMPQSSWRLGNQYPATAINQVHHAAQPTEPSSWDTSGRLSVPSPSQSQSMGSLTQPANQFMTPSQTTTKSLQVQHGPHNVQAFILVHLLKVQVAGRLLVSINLCLRVLYPCQDTLTRTDRTCLLLLSLFLWK